MEHVARRVLIVMIFASVNIVAIHYSNAVSISIDAKDLRTARKRHQTECLPNLVLIGDSTVKRTAFGLTDILSNCTVLRKGHRCNFPSFYGKPYNKSALNVTVPSTLGPNIYGLKNRGCQDCHGCEPISWKCSLFNASLNVEFWGIEFAADVEYPTDGYALTQQSIILGYARAQVTENDYVVFNTGLHDTANVGKLPEVFESQLQFYTELILQVYNKTNILWVTSTYPRGVFQPPEWANITSPLAISRFNEVSRRVMQRYDVEVLDIGLMSTMESMQALYTDGVHVGSPKEKWYSFVAASILHKYILRTVTG